MLMMPRKIKQMNPAPPPTLNKEYSRVWVGWCMIGDREVAREAASKGTYISLALQFIAARKGWDYSDVERWFKSEILAWVYQLVERKQIFKASHILLNIGIDPTEQLSVILSETTNKYIRDYIAEHLLKIGNLELSLLNSWRFILAIENSKDLLSIPLDDISSLSIQKIEQKNTEWKSDIATTIFFISYDLHLESFLTPECVWYNLLSNERLDILKLWINIYFTKNLQYDCKTTFSDETYQKFKNLFLIWEITNLMINEIKSHSNTVQNFIQNELSNFGIFTDDEKDDVSKILSRFSRTQNVQNIFNILEEPTSCFTAHEFFEKLNCFCVNHELYEVLSECSNEYNISFSLIQSSKLLSLWLRKKDNLIGTVTNESLRKYTIAVFDHFSDDITTYLENNPILLISVIIFTKDVNFHDILTNKTTISVDNLNLSAEEIKRILEKLPVLENIIKKYSLNVPDNSNFYNLLTTHTNLIHALEFRKKTLEIPHFGNKNLCSKYGTTENINYIYYIKQHRPSKAAKLFILDQFKNHGRISDSALSCASQKVLSLVLENSFCFDILASCVAFLEMIGKSTNEIRIIINAMFVVNFSKNYPKQELLGFFIKMNENSKLILDMIENNLMEKYNGLDNFIDILEKYELAINFARINNLELPEKLLNYCAENNLWLQFTIFIQIYNYPLEQTLKLTMKFKNKQIMDHLYHALSNEIRIDLNQSLPWAISTNNTNCDLEQWDLTDFTPKSNLLKALMKCHKSGDPPTALLHACQIYRNPLMAILATCYEPDSVIINWLTWLSISTNIDIHVVENYSISPKAVSLLLENVLRKKYIRTLLESFQIFLPENPLHSLVRFLYNCVLLELDSCTTHLKLFEKAISHLNYNTVIINNDFECTFLTNSYWLINTALKLIFATLGNCFESKKHQIRFLNILCTANFAKNVPVNIPNFCAIAKLLESLSSDVKINLTVFLNNEERREEIVKCIEKLVTQNEYKDALELAKYENICKEYVLNEEWLDKFKQQPTSEFWRESEKAFQSADIAASSAAVFYMYCCKNLTDCAEKYQAIKLAYNWLKQSNYSDYFVENIEQEIWANYFALDDATLKESYYDKDEKNYLLSEIHERSNVICKFDHEFTKEQFRHFEETIGKILDSGDIIQALRLEKMFDRKCIETEILLTCYELAEGKLKPYEITAEQRLLFLNRDRNLNPISFRRRTFKSPRGSDSIQSAIILTENEESNFQNTLTLLETLTERLKHGSNIANRILMCYRISVNVNKPYQEIVKHTDSVTLLKTALTNNYKNKFDIVHDIFLIYKWTNSEITNFIFEELKAAIRNSINSNLDYISMWDLDLDLQFPLVLQLCSDSNSHFGKKLLSYIDTIQETQEVVELLIRAHDCFNSYCNMEGIASVLRKAQSVTPTLLNTKNWKLMIRLLTGIGRYSEMNYIFQIIKENDQFEYLLRGNFRQNNSLKVALLKYLEKNCPKNQELFRIVALHFCLFSEVAELWENEANEMIDNLIEIARLENQNQGRNSDDSILFMNNDSTKLSLNKAMTNFTHAAEYHLQGEKLVSAMQAARQAELLALQISILKNVPNNTSQKCILRLRPKQILELVSNELSFPQAKIIIDSYNYKGDWGSIIFKQCVISAKLDYLDDYLAANPLTNTLAQDLTRRFLAEKNISSASVKAMKEILKKLTSVHMRYRLASELGFGDVIETLLSGSQLAFLKDTVWKKGYKQL